MAFAAPYTNDRCREAVHTLQTPLPAQCDRPSSNFLRLQRTAGTAGRGAAKILGWLRQTAEFAEVALCASRPLVLTAALEAARQGGSMAAFRRLARTFRTGSIVSVTSCANDRSGLPAVFGYLDGLAILLQTACRTAAGQLGAHSGSTNFLLHAHAAESVLRRSKHSCRIAAVGPVVRAQCSEFLRSIGCTAECPTVRCECRMRPVADHLTA